MPKVPLEGRSWASTDDFYRALLAALGAPSWHGRNLDALEETFRAGDTNAVNLPVQICISAMASMGEEARQTVRRFQQLVKDLRAADIDINLQLR